VASIGMENGRGPPSIAADLAMMESRWRKRLPTPVRGWDRPYLKEWNRNCSARDMPAKSQLADKDIANFPVFVLKSVRLLADT